MLIGYNKGILCDMNYALVIIYTWINIRKKGSEADKRE